MLLPTIKILTWLVSPIGILTSGLVLAGILHFLRRKKMSLLLGAISITQLLMFSFPLISDSLLEGLENRARALEAQHEHAKKSPNRNAYQAIVVLGGALGPAYPPKRPFADLNDASDRVWHAARLFKQGLAPVIIVSGGKGPGLERREDIASEAVTMRGLLIDLGVPRHAIVLEEQSRTTRENASFTSSLAGDKPVALVTSAFHMPRAYATFRRAGVDVDAYPTDFRAIPELSASWERWLPTASNLQRSEMALKEYLALFLNY